jgi:hypothetical protein
VVLARGRLRVTATVLVMAVVGLLGGCSAVADRPGADPGVPTTPAAGQPVPVPGLDSLPSRSAEAVQPPGRDDHGPEVAAPPVIQARPVAAAFAAAWVADLPTDQWLARIAVLCEPAFGDLLSTTDPTRVPARSITGAPTPVREPADGPAVYTVATDTGELTVTVAAVDGRWLVSGNDFTRTVS